MFQIFNIGVYGVIHVDRANRENMADHGGNLTHPTALPTQLLGHVGSSSEASPTFGHANANFSVFLTV